MWIAESLARILFTDSLSYDEVRRAIITLHSQTANNPRADSLLYSDLHWVKTRLDSLLVDMKASPRTYMNLRVF